MSKSGKIRKLEEQERRLAFFKQDYDHYEEKKVEDKWYVKMLLKNNSDKGRWIVAIYPEKSFIKYKGYGKYQQSFEDSTKEELD